MEKKIFLHGNVVAICPECGLEFPVSIADIINGNEIICPVGKFTAHPDKHSTIKGVCDSTECKTSSEHHTFTISKDNFVEI